MTTHKRTTLPSLNAKPDVLEAVAMYLSAKHEGDEFRMEAAGRHLELIEYFLSLNQGFPEWFESGSGRRS
jgi:hypothetical protein